LVAQGDKINQTGLRQKKALSAIKLIRKYTNTIELLQILTCNYYSVLYYNCKVWTLLRLNVDIKKQMLTASANALKMALHFLEGLEPVSKKIEVENCLLKKYVRGWVGGWVDGCKSCSKDFLQQSKS
jgi:hypothetical protein